MFNKNIRFIFSNGLLGCSSYCLIDLSFKLLIKNNHVWNAFAHPVRLSVGGPKGKNLHNTKNFYKS